jgi:hypothetical protein
MNSDFNELAERPIEQTPAPVVNIASVLSTPGSRIVGTAVEAVTKFRTSDGISFETLPEARLHHALQAFIEACHSSVQNPLRAEDFIVPTKDIADWILDNREIVHVFLARCDAIAVNKADPY